MLSLIKDFINYNRDKLLEAFRNLFKISNTIDNSSNSTINNRTISSSLISINFIIAIIRILINLSSLIINKILVIK